MDRRQFNSAATTTLGVFTLGASTQCHALTLGQLSKAEASQGVKTAIETGALAAVGLLGKTDGFLNNPNVRIPLPGFLADAAKFLRAVGQGKRVEELEIAMNRAA